MSRLTTGQAPYFDDFDSSKNFQKILFKSDVPVQTRELNQIQSITQNQLEKFANHIFKNGSRVSNASASLYTAEFVRLQDISPWNSKETNIQVALGTKIVGATSGIEAVLTNFTQKDAVDPATLYVVYTLIAIDGETTNFIPGELLKFFDGNNVQVYSAKVRCPGCANSTETESTFPLGKGKIFTIDEGIFYYEGMFIENSRQTVIVDKYGTSPNVKIGFNFIQSFVNSQGDGSLLDNSLGYPNSTAPGADRYKVDLVLVVKDLDSVDSDDFINLAKIENNAYTYLKSDSEYSDIMDMIAKRTYETNGNFTVNPFRLSFIEEKAEFAGDPNGYSIDGNEDNAKVVISPGVAYVKGYRFENQNDAFITIEKARETKNLPGFIKRFDDRAYIILEPGSTNSVNPNNALNSAVIDGTVIDIKDGAPTPETIGSFKVYDVRYIDGVIGTNARFKYYIYDLEMVAGRKLSEAVSYVDAAGVYNFLAHPDSANNGTQENVIYNPGKTELIWNISRPNIKSLRSIDSTEDDKPGSINIVLRKKLIGVLNSERKVTFNSASNEYFMPYDTNGTVVTFIGADNQAGSRYSLIHANPASLFTIDATSLTFEAPTLVSGESPVGWTVSILHDVLRTNAKENGKDIDTVVVSDITPTNASIMLGVTDAVSILSVQTYTNNSTNYTDYPDLSEFTLYPAQTNSTYNESYVVFTGTTSSDPDERWKIEVSYFAHDKSSALGYYTVDSYTKPIDDNDIEYSSKPSFTSTQKVKYELFSSFDFRPDVDITNDSIPSGMAVPSIGSTAIFDLSYYLPRTDLLNITSSGAFSVTKGIPSDTPIPPKANDDEMPIYEIKVPAYTYSAKDITTKFIENKRYTMRDIGRLEERVKSVEYYTVLNLLEKKTADMNIKDAAGLDRFKNGLVADDFSAYQAADVESSDFRASNHPTDRELQPQFTPRNKGLSLYNKGHALDIAGMIINPYSSVKMDSQPYATKHISINPYFQFKRVGQVVLDPLHDNWVDTKREPKLSVNIDTGVAAYQALAAKLGVTNALNSLQKQATTSYSLGDRVTDVSLKPKMRAIKIQFKGKALKKNTKVWVFFDKKNVSAYVQPIGGKLGQQLITDKNGELIGYFHVPADMFYTGDREFVITSDQNFTGDNDLETTRASAVFWAGGLNVTKQTTELNVTTPFLPPPPPPPPKPPIPDPAQKCFVSLGDMAEFYNIPDPWHQIRGGRNYQPFNGVAMQKWRDMFNAFGGQAAATAQSPAIDWQMFKVLAASFGVTNLPATANICANYSQDPIAQSFKFEEDRFLTKLTVYFKDVDKTDQEVYFQIRPMVNGYPSSSTILADKRFPTSALTFSENSRTPFTVEFDFPIFIKGGEEYCFVVGGWSPETRIWVAKLGMPIVDQPNKILEMQPSLGSSFRSQNGTTWTAEQSEDIKYDLYAAQFAYKDMTLTFRHVPEREEIVNNPFEGQAGSNRIRVHIPDHGLNAGDKTTIYSQEDAWVKVVVTPGSTIPVSQQALSFTGGSATVEQVKQEGNDVYLKLSNITGWMVNGGTWNCASLSVPLGDSEVMRRMSLKTSEYKFNATSGTFVIPTGADMVNGISYKNLNKQHTVIEVDSMDSFIIVPDALELATASGRFGDAVLININEKYESFSVTGSYLPYGATESWNLTGIGHNTPNGPFTSMEYAKQTPIAFSINSDVDLNSPYKMVSADNITSNRYTEVSVTFQSPNYNLSPVLNKNTLSINTISNRVEWVTKEQLEVVPLASSRFLSESDPMNGSENYKYVTKDINLKNPAIDLIIAFDCFKDKDADFDVWVKINKPYDGGDINEKRWVKVNGISKVNSADKNDRIEYEMTLSSMNVEVFSDNTTSSVMTWGAYLGAGEMFSSFKVKIVGRTKNPAKPPLFQSLRVIAVL